MTTHGAELAARARSVQAGDHEGAIPDIRCQYDMDVIVQHGLTIEDLQKCNVLTHM